VINVLKSSSNNLNFLLIIYRAVKYVVAPAAVIMPKWASVENI